MAVAVVVAGCTDGTDSASDSAKAGGGNTAATAESTSASATPDGAPGMNADTRTACTTISGDIETTMAKVAKAEKIGPPAGHSAVSAEYSAGAAGLYAHMFTASTKVNDAAKHVATAMSDLADTYATAPEETPSKTTLSTAVKQFQAACAAN
ncbi:hypothetical protein [Micromonospora inositola]|nr:hypothetical protein [Micromonospora inositola]